MKIANPLKWGFDPRKRKRPAILSTVKGRLLWGLLKTGHLTDQFFNHQCALLLKSILKDTPRNGMELYQRACSYNMRGYAIKEDRNTTQNDRFFGCVRMIPDLEFWGELLDAITGKIKVKMEYPKEQQ